MSETVEPALKPVQWAAVMDEDFENKERLGHATAEAALYEVPMHEDVGIHGLAALCLYGQPFGFTREDVAVLKRSIEVEESSYFYGSGKPTYEAHLSWLRSMLARVEALLPPTPTETP